jgi:hypothetical protein
MLSPRARIGIEGKDLHCLVALAMFRKLMKRERTTSAFGGCMFAN